MNNLENLIWNLPYYENGRVPKFGDYYTYTTNLICDFWFRSRREGMKVIREAEKAGYIRRDRMQAHKYNTKRGRYYIIHSLTPKGKQFKDSLRARIS